MTTDTKIVPIPQWLEPEAAAAVLGISVRTLRHRAAKGQVTRRRDGSTVLYQVRAAAMPNGKPLAIAAATPTRTAMPNGNASELVNALVSAVDRAARAEARIDALTAEADRLRGQVRELEADLHLTTADLRAVNARVERVMVHWEDCLRARRRT